MSFSKLLLLILRRWYLIVVGTLGACALAFSASTWVAPVYEMSADVVLLPPQSAVGELGNPFLAMGNLEAAIDVTAAGLAGGELQQRVVALGAESTAARDTSASAPILVITVTAGSEVGVRDALGVMLDAVPGVVRREQTAVGVKQKDMIGSQLIASSDQPAVSRSPQLRAVIVVLGLGLLLTLALTALLDRYLARSGDRRRSTPRESLSEGTARRQERSGRSTAATRVGSSATPTKRPPPYPPPAAEPSPAPTPPQPQSLSNHKG